MRSRKSWRGYGRSASIGRSSSRSPGRYRRDTGAYALGPRRRRPGRHRGGCGRRHRALRRRDRHLRDGRRDRAGRVRGRRDDPPFEVGLRALAPRRRDGDGQPAGIAPIGDRCGRRAEGRVRRRHARARTVRRKAWDVLRSDGRGDRRDRRLHRNASAIRARDRARAPRAGCVRAIGLRADGRGLRDRRRQRPGEGEGPGRFGQRRSCERRERPPR